MADKWMPGAGKKMAPKGKLVARLASKGKKPNGAGKNPFKIVATG